MSANLENSKKRKLNFFNSKFFATKNFGFALAFLVFVFLSWFAFFSGLHFFERWDRSLSDIYFRFKSVIAPQVKQEGASISASNYQVSQDILIAAIDNNSLETLGKWPFPRHSYADFLNTLSRITDIKQRENSVLFDIFYFDKDRQVENDVALKNSIQENSRVFLESVIEAPQMDNEFAKIEFDRLKNLERNSKTLRHINGDWKNVPTNLTIYNPLKILAQVSSGFGHATFTSDDDKIFRRQQLVAKVTEIIEEINIENLKEDISDIDKKYQRYIWIKKDGSVVNIPNPLTVDVINNVKNIIKKEGLVRQVPNEENPDEIKEVYIVQKVQDHFIPSITLALALNYWNVSYNDVVVELGSRLLIKNIKSYNSAIGTWEHYTVPVDNEGKDRKTLDSISIPIDSEGSMTINYAGPRSSERGDEYQTFPIRSFSSYVLKAPSIQKETWKTTRELANKIIMVGAFATGVADDEKNTPFGQMFGVEIHANALNTILMNRFLVPLPVHYSLIILFLMIILIAIFTSRLTSFLSLILTFLLFIIAFISVTVVFDLYSIIIPFSVIATGILLTFIIILVYRTLTEERDKKLIKSMFGKYVSPDVVSQILENPPELGGVDKELTVLFSDIRGFTTLSEGMSPQELVNHLNIYLSAMTDLILEYKGTLDKYVGDEIMCFWGAPLEQKDHAILACKCALKMMERLKELNETWPESKKINIGIGLNSGIMTVGNMGSLGRMNYTLMGDNVNLGARLEGTNKEYMTHVIISEFTYAYIKEKAIVRELDNIRVKGKNKPVIIYELIDFIDGLDVNS